MELVISSVPWEMLSDTRPGAVTADEGEVFRSGFALLQWDSARCPWWFSGWINHFTSHFWMCVSNEEFATKGDKMDGEEKKRKRTKYQRDLFDDVWPVRVRVKIAFQVLDPNADLRNWVVSFQIAYKAFTGCFVELTIHICQTFLSPHKQTLMEVFLPEESNPLRASKETHMDFCLFSVSIRGFDWFFHYSPS